MEVPLYFIQHQLIDTVTFNWTSIIVIHVAFIDVLGGAGSATEGSSCGKVDGGGGGDDEAGDEQDDGEMKIQDETQMNTMALRRAIYLTIMSSVIVEECAHKIVQINIKPGQELGGATAYI